MTAEKEKELLKSCPFCGGEVFSDWNGTLGHYYIKCNGCKLIASFPRFNGEEEIHIKDWQTRQPELVLDEEKELLAKIDDLIIQATKERSHYYTANLLKECREYILSTRKPELAKRVQELETVLEAWHDVFGTTQLTHAKDRLDQAEKRQPELVPLDFVDVGNFFMDLLSCDSNEANEYAEKFINKFGTPKKLSVEKIEKILLRIMGRKELMQTGDDFCFVCGEPMSKDKRMRLINFIAEALHKAMEGK